MKPIFNQVCILGLGLMGGCLAIDLKQRGLAGRVVAYNRGKHRRRLAIKNQICDETFLKPEQAVVGSDLVVFATPVGTIPNLARRIAPFLSEGTILTDLGSTKAILVQKLNKIFSSKTPFIGSHPIAGTEKSGVEAAFSGLFEKRWWLFTPTQKGKAHQLALKKLSRMVRACGAKVALLSPKEHDDYLAAISHLPHMVAYGVVHTAQKSFEGKALKYAAGGFGDYTRIAASSPQMWAEICLDNKKSILKILRQFMTSMKKIETRISNSDVRGLTEIFSQAARIRRKL